MGGADRHLRLPRGGPAVAFIARAAAGVEVHGQPKAIVRDFIETDSPANLMETHRELALRFGKWLDRNQKRLNALYVIFAGASALLAVQVGAWLLALTKGN
jgi:hypothetical protein